MDNTNTNENVSSSVPEKRKNSKPIMEKRRRARINASLAELKTFLLDMIKKEGLRHNKMEKADILELTVKHLRQLRRQSFTDTGDSFGKGFSECASEVSKFMNSLPGMETEMKARLLEHLSRYSDRNSTRENLVAVTNSTIQSHAYKVENRTPVTPTDRILKEDIFEHPKAQKEVLQCQPPQASGLCLNVQQANLPLLQSAFIPSSLSMIQNSVNSVVSPVNSILSSQSLQIGNVMGGVQIVPARLPSGQTALIIPTNFVANTCIPNNALPLIASVNATNINSQGQLLKDVGQSEHDSAVSSDVSQDFRILQNTANAIPITKQSNISLQPQNIRTVDLNSIVQQNSNSNMADSQNNTNSSNDLLNRELHDPVWRPW